MGIRMIPSCFRPNFGSKASASGRKPVDPQPAKTSSKEGKPAGLGSQQERPEIKHARPPITQAMPDAHPPKTFGRIPGTPFVRKGEGSKQKIQAMARATVTFQNLEPHIRRNPELMKMIKEKHPNFETYSPNGKAKTLKVIDQHPGYLAIVSKVQNEMGRLPTGPTSTRMMTPGEQKFLTNAFQQVDQEVRKNPFIMHGETAITGTKDGKITQFNFNPGLTSKAIPEKGDKYHLHTHPPFMEPATSSASLEDHLFAARHYAMDNKKTLSYVTNGKDVLHIPPNSTELVKLIPDPKQEKKLGEFPVAFTVPIPQEPPRPFSNHEAPPTFKPWDREK